MTGSFIARLGGVFVRRRYDLFAMACITVAVVWFFLPIFASGHIEFSDFVVPVDTRGYLNESFGLWNGRTNEPAASRLPQLPVVLLPWIVSAAGRFSGVLFAKALIIQAALLSAGSVYLLALALSSRLPRWRRSGVARELPVSFAAAGAAIFAVLNPWFIQHLERIYVLYGFAMVPLLVLCTFRLFSGDLRELVERPAASAWLRLSPGTIGSAFGFGVALSIAAVDAVALYGVVAFLSVAVPLLVAKNLFGCRQYRCGAYPRIVAAALLRMALVGLWFLIVSWHWILPGLEVGGIVAPSVAPETGFQELSRSATLPWILYLVGHRSPWFDPAGLGVGFYIAGSFILAIAVFGAATGIRDRCIAGIASLVPVFYLASAGANSTISARFVSAIERAVGGTIDPGAPLAVVVLLLAVLVSLGLSKLFTESDRERPSRIIVRVVTLVTYALALWSYGKPLHAAYFDGYYAPVSRPVETAGRSGELPGRVLSLPPAGTAASSVYLYQAAWLQQHLDLGTTRDFAHWLPALDVNRLLYAPGSSGSPDRRRFNLDVLALQRNARLQPSGPAGLREVAFAEPFVSSSLVPLAVHSVFGLSARSALSTLTGTGARRYAYLYTHAETGSMLGTVRDGDLIETAGFDDLWLSSLDSSYHLPVSAGIDYANPHLRWSRSSVLSPRWAALLENQRIATFPFEFDLDLGLAVTFASVTIETPDYESLDGATTIDLESLERLGLSFVPADATADSVVAAPLDRRSRFPEVGLEPTEPDGVAARLVARSGRIVIHPSTPYRLHLLLSGIDVDTVELSIRFYDSSERDVGYAYDAVPDRIVRDDPVAITGLFVAPATARSFVVEIRSRRDRSTRIRWWIHRFDVVELAAHSVDNDLRINTGSDRFGEYRAYIRLFRSQSGGPVEVIVGDTVIPIDTRTRSRNRFEWVPLGTVALDGRDIRVRNLYGFQAVNAIVAVPVAEFDRSRYPVRRAIDRGAVFVSLEAEDAFEYSGHLQTTRRYPDLSLGHGIASANGTLERDIEIIESGEYRIILRASGNRDRSSIEVRVTDLESGEIQSRRVELVAALPAVSKRPMIETDDASNTATWPRSIEEHAGALPDLQFVMLDSMYLGAGRYRLEIRLESRAANLVSLYGIRPFDPASLPDSKVPLISAEPGCSPCERIVSTMVSYSVQGGVFTARLEPTCSCDWYVLSSSQVGVSGNDEYLVRYRLRSTLVRERHVKLLFLDDSSRVIGVETIPESAASESEAWQEYEYLVEIPRGANQMLFQIWGRGDYVRSSRVDLRDLVILPYRELPMVDVCYLFEADALAILAANIADTTEVTLEPYRDGLRYSVRIDEPPGAVRGALPEVPARPYLVDLGLASDSGWDVLDNAGEYSMVPIDGTGTGVFGTNRTLEIAMRGRVSRLVGLTLLSLSVPLLLVTMRLAGPGIHVRRVVTQLLIRLRTLRQGRSSGESPDADTNNS